MMHAPPGARTRRVPHVTPGALDDRLTRGGPVVRTPLYGSLSASIGSDDRKKFSAVLQGRVEGTRDNSYARTITLTMTSPARSASGPGWQTRMNNDLRKAVMRKAGASKAMARKVMRVRRARKAAKKSSRARA